MLMLLIIFDRRHFLLQNRALLCSLHTYFPVSIILFILTNVLIHIFLNNASFRALHYFATVKLVWFMQLFKQLDWLQFMWHTHTHICIFIYRVIAALHSISSAHKNVQNKTPNLICMERKANKSTGCTQNEQQNGDTDAQAGNSRNRLYICRSGIYICEWSDIYIINSYKALSQQGAGGLSRKYPIAKPIRARSYLGL